MAEQVRRSDNALAWIFPRGIGPTAWSEDGKKGTQILRRFALLGQTLDGMRVWDVRRAIQTIRSIDDLSRLPLDIADEGEMGVVALYASLFEPNINRLVLSDLPRSHHDGPQFLNVLQTLDIPAAVAMAAERSPIDLTQGKQQNNWEYPLAVAKKLGWGAERIQIEHGR